MHRLAATCFVVLSSLGCGRTTIGFFGDDVGVGGPTVIIDEGAEYTRHLEVRLSLHAVGATRVVLAPTLSGCSAALAWEPMVASRSYVLTQANAANTVFARFGDDSGRVTACVGDLIVHDDLPPLPPTELRVEWEGRPDLAAGPTLVFSGSDRGPSGIATFLARALDDSTSAPATSWVEVTSGQRMAIVGGTLLAGSRYRVELFARDRAANEGLPVRSERWSDTMAEHLVLGVFPIFLDFRFGDLTGDDRLEVVAFSSWGGEAQWYPNIGGPEQLDVPRSLFGSEVETSDLEVADIDADGVLDIVVAARSTGEVAWYPSDIPTSGHLVARRVVTTEALEPRSLAVDDLDGDGDLDVAVASFGDDRVVWLANEDGRGTFGAARALASSQDGPITVETADLDVDGLPDLVVISENDCSTVWYRNEGAGNFASGQPVVSAGCTVIKARDLDNDGDLDLMDRSRWFRNVDGLGNFTAAVLLTSDAIQGSDAAELDNTPGADLVLSVQALDDEVRWAANDGTGTFGSSSILYTLPFGTEAYTVAAVDLDADGDTDILTEQLDPEALLWFENTGAGVFATPTAIGNPLINRPSVALADVDNDADLDVVFAASNGTYWLEREGSITVAARKVSSALGLQVADLNGDGRLDLVTQSPTHIGWCAQTGPGQFAPSVNITTAVAGLRDVAIADVDGDGDADLLSASHDDNKLAWYRNDGTGTFGTQLIITTTLARAVDIAPGDLDGDGDLDVAGGSISGAGSTHWYRNTDGLGSFSGPVQTVTWLGYGLGVADVDGDLDADIIGSVSWTRNTDGAGALSSPMTFGGGGIGEAVVDLDRDGDVDVVSRLGGGIVGWASNNGDGTFVQRTLGDRFVCLDLAVGDLVPGGPLEVIVVDQQRNDIYAVTPHGE